MKISQKARFEKNYIVWKLEKGVQKSVGETSQFEKNYIVWKPVSRTYNPPTMAGLRRTI